MVRSYDDLIKQKTREKLRNFIEKYLLSFRKPSQLSVVCFPGAEKEGEEGLEVKEVYFPLGIPPENILGLEYDRKKAERLRQANLGIEVVCQDALDFFESTDRHFDVISLDYTGQQTEDAIKTLEFIAGRHVLANYGVLCTNYSGKRESPKLKNRLFRKYIHTISSDSSKKLGLSQVKDNEALITLLENAANGDFDLAELRDSITLETLSTFKTASFRLGNTRVVTSHPYYDFVRHNSYLCSKDFLKTEEGKRLRDAFIGLGVHTEKEYEEMVDHPEIHKPSFIQDLLIGLQEHIKDRSGISRDIAKFLAVMLHYDEIRPYFPRAIERYSYNSNKNALMLFDMFSFDQCLNNYRKLKDIILYDPNTSNVSVNPFHFPKKKFRKMVVKLSQQCYNQDHAVKVPERAYLGSSWVPPERKEMISEKDAKYLLSEGVPVKEILETYDGFKKMQLAGFLSHITRARKKK